MGLNWFVKGCKSYTILLTCRSTCLPVLCAPSPAACCQRTARGPGWMAGWGQTAERGQQKAAQRHVTMHTWW